MSIVDAYCFVDVDGQQAMYPVRRPFFQATGVFWSRVDLEPSPVIRSLFWFCELSRFRRLIELVASLDDLVGQIHFRRWPLIDAVVGQASRLAALC